jgi:protein-tyrosine phosphatase
MIDLHSHIIYGVDDGAQTRDEALAMCRLAAADGVRIIAATPHSPASVASRNYDTTIIQQQSADLQQQLQAEGIELQVIAGTEIRYSAEIINQLRAGQLLPYHNRKLILLEVANDALAQHIEHAAFVAQASGYRVIIPHPERCTEVQKNPHILRPLVERGVAMQLTAAALIGEQGDQLAETSNQLISLGYAHIIASDAHGMPPRRTTQISAAREHISKQYGQEIAETLSQTNPELLLNNKPLPKPIIPSKGTSFWQKFRH